jgi:AcrR family transcriptional regulator
MEATPVAEERRAQIIEAAIHILLQEGIAEATTRKITAQAGVNGATLNYYFGSKDKLLMAVFERILRDTEAAIWNAVRTDQGLAATIESHCRTVWSYLEQTPEVQILQYELSLYAIRHPESAWLVKWQYEWYCQGTEAIFRQGCGTGNEVSVIPLADLASFVVAGMDGLLLQFLADRDTIRARRGLDRLISAALALALDNDTIQPGRKERADEA